MAISRQNQPGFHSGLHFHCFIGTGYNPHKDFPSFRVVLPPQEFIDSIFQMVSQAGGL